MGHTCTTPRLTCTECITRSKLRKGEIVEITLAGRNERLFGLEVIALGREVVVLTLGATDEERLANMIVLAVSEIADCETFAV